MPVTGCKAQTQRGEAGHRNADQDDFARVPPVEQVAENGLSESIRPHTNGECPGQSERAQLKVCPKGNVKTREPSFTPATAAEIRAAAATRYQP